MNISLTTKERLLLEDQKSHEQICIQKYNNYANLASCPQLKEIFRNNARIEQEHLNTINQLLSGNVPSVSNQQGGSSAGQQQPSQQQMNTQQMSQQQMNQQNIQQSWTMQPQSTGNVQTQNNTVVGFQVTDKDLCTDMLMTEKYVSSTYNTAIFEFKDPQVRDVLNHIQKEEQKHGEAIYKYMESKGMYTPQ
ncbi:MAG TPA: spore coat protein [Clostridiaceae bacterium]|nr:spore coat protein [Clostridiaceae bacterium]